MGPVNVKDTRHQHKTLLDRVEAGGRKRGQESFLGSLHCERSWCLVRKTGCGGCSSGSGWTQRYDLVAAKRVFMQRRPPLLLVPSSSSLRNTGILVWPRRERAAMES